MIGEQHDLVGRCGLQVEHRGQRVVVDDDELGSVDRLLTGRREDRHDRLADIAGDVAREVGPSHLLGEHGQHVRGEAHAGDVGGGEHPGDTRGRGRGVHVDAGDRGVGEDRPHVHEVEGVVEIEIVDVGAPGRQKGHVLATDHTVAQNAHDLPSLARPGPHMSMASRVVETSSPKSASSSPDSTAKYGSKILAVSTSASSLRSRTSSGSRNGPVNPIRSA